MRADVREESSPGIQGRLDELQAVVTDDERQVVLRFATKFMERSVDAERVFEISVVIAYGGVVIEARKTLGRNRIFSVWADTREIQQFSELSPGVA